MKLQLGMERSVEKEYSHQVVNKVDAQRKDSSFCMCVFFAVACDLTLDPNTAGDKVVLMEDNKKAKHVQECDPHPDHPERFDGFKVLCREALTGRHYWEVEHGSSDDIAVAYKSMAREGDSSDEFAFGKNAKSWSWSNEGGFQHKFAKIDFSGCVNSFTGRTGVYLDWPAGILSFFKVSPDTLTHLYTEHTKFTEPLHPGFSVGDTIHLCNME